MSQSDLFELVELNALAIARHRLLDLPNGDELSEAIDNGTARVDLEPASATEMSILVNEPSIGTRTHLATVTNDRLTFNPSDEEWSEAIHAKTRHLIACRDNSAELQEQIKRGERTIESHTQGNMTSIFIMGGVKPIWLGDLHVLDILRPIELRS